MRVEVEVYVDFATSLLMHFKTTLLFFWVWHNSLDTTYFICMCACVLCCNNDMYLTQGVWILHLSKHVKAFWTQERPKLICMGRCCEICLQYTHYCKRIFCCGINSHVVDAQIVGEPLLQAPGISTRLVGVTKTTIKDITALGLSRYLLETLSKREWPHSVLAQSMTGPTYMYVLNMCFLNI